MASTSASGGGGGCEGSGGGSKDEGISLQELTIQRPGAEEILRHL